MQVYLELYWGGSWYIKGPVRCGASISFNAIMKATYFVFLACNYTRLSLTKLMLNRNAGANTRVYFL